MRRRKTSKEAATIESKSYTTKKYIKTTPRRHLLMMKKIMRRRKIMKMMKMTKMSKMMTMSAERPMMMMKRSWSDT